MTAATHRVDEVKFIETEPRDSGPMHWLRVTLARPGGTERKVGEYGVSVSSSDGYAALYDADGATIDRFENNDGAIYRAAVQWLNDNKSAYLTIHPDA